MIQNLRVSFLLCAISGAFLCILPLSTIAFLTAEVVGIGAFCNAYVLMISSSGSLSLPLAMHFSVGFSYTLSTSIFSVSTGIWSPTDISKFVGLPIVASAESVSYALALILVVQAACILAHLTFKPIKTNEWRGTIFSRGGKWFVLTLCAFVAYSFANGNVGFMGVQLSSESDASSVGIMAITILPAATALAIFLAVTEKRIFWIAVALAMTFVVALAGRRFLAYTLITIPIISAMCNRPLRLMSVVRLTPIIVASGAALYFVFQFFVAVRLAMWSMGGEASIVDLLQKAIDLYFGGQFYAVLDYISQTTASRSLVIYYLAGMIEAFRGGRLPLYGAESGLSFLSAIPSAIWHEKLQLLPAAIEDFVHPIIGFPIFDGPNTIVVTGFTDFGPIGAVIYPVAKVWMLGQIIRLSMRMTLTQTAPILITLIAVISVIYIEQAFAGDFITVRNIVMILFAIHVVELILRLLQHRKSGLLPP